MVGPYVYDLILAEHILMKTILIYMYFRIGFIFEIQTKTTNF